VGLIKTGEETHILVADMHHIIADDLSMGLLVKEFISLYRGEDLAPLQTRYRDFALWQTGLPQNAAAQASLKRQETYWLDELAGDTPPLNLPLDFPRPMIRQYDGSSVPFELDKETAGLLKKLAAAEGGTLYILLLAIFFILLAKLCDREDILVGTPIAGRRHPDLETVIGFFATILVIRGRPNGQKNFRDFLREIKDKTLAAYENQDYTYEELVDKLSIRDPGRNALFDVVFVWEDLEIHLGDLTLPHSEREEERLKLKLFNYEKIHAPFDLIFTGAESGETMNFFINYSTVLFKKETIEKIVADFMGVISAVLKDPGMKLGDIEVAHDLLEATPQAFMEESGDFGF
jgi:tyrocidine synthetase-3